MSLYHYDSIDFEHVENIKELEMKGKGYDFITNFTLEREEVYRQSAEIHGLKYVFENEVYGGYGHKLGDDGKWMKAFYVDSNVNDLSDFWRTVDELRSRQ